MKAMRRFRLPLYMVSGVLASLPIIFDSLPLLAWVSMVPVLILELTADRSKKSAPIRAYGRGLLYFYFFGLGVFYWFIELYPLDFAGFTKGAALSVVLVAWLGLPLLQATLSALLFVIFDLFMRRLSLSKKPMLVPLVFASLYPLFEFVQTLTWAGVPWAKLALTQTSFLPALQSVSLLGPYFLSFIIVLVNGYIAAALLMLAAKKDSRTAAACFAVAAVVFSSNLLFGVIRMNVLSFDEGTPIRAAVLQGNVSSKEKWVDGADDLGIYSALVKDAADDGAELIILPESALPYSLDYPNNPYLRSKISALAENNGCELLVGGLETPDEDTLLNSMFYVGKDGEISPDTYVKRHLVPFGEYVPMRDFFMTVIPPLADLTMLSVDMSPGTETAVMQAEKAKIGCIICFDSIYESLTRASVMDGAEIISVSTNDSWFSDSKAIYEHNRHSVLRAVENCRYLMRAANTGVSSFVSPFGEVISSTKPLVKDYLVADVYPITDMTPYTVLGDVCLIAYALILGASIVYLTIKKHKTERLGK